MTHENTPTITTDRLILRRFTQADAQAMFEILRDEKTNVFLPWFPMNTLAQATDFMQERFIDTYGGDLGYRYAICTSEDDRPVGYVCLCAGESCDFGYGLRSDFWHRGIVTEAASAVVERIRTSGIAYITATHDINNPRSGAVMKKLGMSYKYSYVELLQPKNIEVTFRLYQLNFEKPADWVYPTYWDKYSQHFIEENF